MWRYYYWSWKNSTDEYKNINIKAFKDSWFLDKFATYRKWTFSWKRDWVENSSISVEIRKQETEWTLRVYFTKTDYDWTKKELDYKIPLVSTPCNYWWVRWWFLCPCKENRCSVLYLQTNWIFASRKTLDLCYDEQKKNKRWRLMWYLMWDAFTKIELVRRTMKYPVRNWKWTIKARRILKLKQQMPTMNDVNNMWKLLWWDK